MSSWNAMLRSVQFPMQSNCAWFLFVSHSISVVSSSRTLIFQLLSGDKIYQNYQISDQKWSRVLLPFWGNVFTQFCFDWICPPTNNLFDLLNFCFTRENTNWCQCFEIFILLYLYGRHISKKTKVYWSFLSYAPTKKT